MENQKKVIGIIAEYNPFHNGHAYQIQRAKEMADADFVVVLM
ncbi:MAG: nucleotidyltransferase family protein, partial [Lachnospiraceae bacterium]|nr:nucleotidyltransferase family protein [Lachnospiraceae bacterium]